MNEVVSITISSLNHIVSVPGFWLTMGFTTGISMFVNASLFDGNLQAARRAFVAKMLYGGTLLWISVSQIIDARLSHPEVVTENIKPLTYVVALNIVVISIAWVFGFIIGVQIIRMKYRNKLEKF